MHFLSLALAFSTLALGQPALVPGSEGRKDPAAELAAALEVLRRTQDPQGLEKAALAVARSKPPEALPRLVNYLLDPVFLCRMDAERDYKKYYGFQRSIQRVLKAIGEQDTAEADKALMRLANDENFMAVGEREASIIRAAGEIRHPSRRLLAFLDQKATPEEWTKYIAIEALARMRSPDACALIEKRLALPDYEAQTKVCWFIDGLLPVRDSPAIVGLYRRVLEKGVTDEKLRNRIVQSLFDYRPRDWAEGRIACGGDPQPGPPPRKEASTDALQELLKIADIALNLDLWKETREGVVRERGEIQDRLRRREAATPKRLAALIADLDHDDFKTRERATAELRALGDEAENALRQALAGRPSPEARQRLEQLLEDLKPKDAREES
jgi:HEAT repeat protein